MNDEATLRQFIKNSIIDGHERHKTFKLLYSKFGDADQKYSSLFNVAMFNRFLIHYKEKSPQDLLLSLTLIDEEFKKAESYLEKRRCPTAENYSCKLLAITERYALDLSRGQKETVYLFDGLYEQKRPLQIESNNLKINYDSQFAAINSDHFLIANPLMNSAKGTHLYLMHLNIQELKSTLLDTKLIKDYFRWAIADQSNAQRLLIHTRSGDDTNTGIKKFYITSIENGKLECLRKFKFNDDDLFEFALKFQDNKLVYIKNGEKLAFVELELGPGQLTFTQLWEFDRQHQHNIVQFQTIPFKPYYFVFGHATWVGNCLYTIKFNSYQPTELIKYDLDLQQEKKLMELNINIPCDCQMVDNCLIVWTLAGESRQHRCRKIPVGQPDKLTNLVFNSILQKLVFVDEKARTAFVRRLPPNLRPFGQQNRNFLF